MCNYETFQVQSCSKWSSFAGLYRILWYLATHPHRPIFYPRNKMESYEELRVDYDSPYFDCIELPNRLATVVDSGLTRDNVSRKSCHCTVGLLNGVAIQHKCKQQKATALHSTHSALVLTKIFTGQHHCISTANHASTVFKPIQLQQDKSILRFQLTSYMNKLKTDELNYERLELLLSQPCGLRYKAQPVTIALSSLQSYHWRTFLSTSRLWTLQIAGTL